MRKLLAGYLIAAITIASLTGCGSDSTGGSIKSAESSNSGNMQWPERTIEVIVPFSAGGDTDIYGRLLSEAISKELGCTMVIINQAGVSGTVGARTVKDSPADGYKVLFNHSVATFQEALGATDYSFAEDFALAGTAIVDNTYVVAIRKEAGLKTMKEVIEYLEANPEGLTVGTCYGGGDQYVVMQLEKDCHVKFKQVDVGSSATERVAGIVGGQCDILPVNYGNIADYVTTGDLILLGTTGEERSALLPGTPTLKEQGYDAVFAKKYGFRFPKETSPEIVERFAEALKKTVTDKELEEKVNTYFAEMKFTSGNEQYKEEKEMVSTIKEFIGK